MITLNVVWFLLMLAGAVSAGAWVTWHIHGVNAAETERVRRFMRGVDVNDAADMGEQS